MMAGKEALFRGSALLIAGFAGALACGPAPNALPDEPTREEDPMVTEARTLYPRFVDVQAYIIGRSCAPNAGVCHNTNNYPDLHTPGNTLSQLRAYCNIEIPDPLQGWDSCERPGDVVYVGAFHSEIAWMEQVASYRWRIGLREAPATELSGRPQIYTQDDKVVLEPVPDWNVTLIVPAGAAEGEIVVDDTQPFIADFVDAVLASVIGGDPNQNGVFGGTDPDVPKGALIVPGHPERSYLWGRITGTVPGSRMPLANQPLSDAEYVAIACWIEGLPEEGEPGVDDPIDYDGCAFAKEPVAYAVE